MGADEIWKLASRMEIQALAVLPTRRSRETRSAQVSIFLQRGLPGRAGRSEQGQVADVAQVTNIAFQVKFAT